jgi:hypothetical protein
VAQGPRGSSAATGSSLQENRFAPLPIITDAVMTEQGMTIFEGSGGATRHQPADFVPLSKASTVSSNTRARVTGLDAACSDTGGPHVLQHQRGHMPIIDQSEKCASDYWHFADPLQTPARPLDARHASRK